MSPARIWGACVASGPALFLLSFGPAFAQQAAGDGHAAPGQIGSDAHADSHEIAFFHNWILLPIITVICLFVLGLLLYVIFRFNAKANPTPSRPRIIPVSKWPGPSPRS